MKNKSRVFTCGDIHGAYKALKQVLEASGFNCDNDTLIQLGDITDGFNEVYEVVEELLKIKNLIVIRGNHDDWFKYWLEYGEHPVNWNQGGLGTLHSYCRNLNKEYSGIYEMKYTNLVPEDIPETHKDFFKNQLAYYIDSNNRLFIHGGFDRTKKISDIPEMDHDYFYWDRYLWRKALSVAPGTKLKTEDNFSEIFIGHTTTLNWNKDVPMFSGGVINLDTGAGFRGKLTLMDINNKDIFQSDNVNELYPNWKGR